MSDGTGRMSRIGPRPGARRAGLQSPQPCVSSRSADPTREARLLMKPLKIKIFWDGADPGPMLDAYRCRRVQGFTTNPTLMRNAGVTDYECFARDILSEVKDLPVSFEVFSDDFDEMMRQ